MLYYYITSYYSTIMSIFLLY